MPLIRLVTVHPIFVHTTVGTLPVMVLAYVLAAWKRSVRWTFVGDVVLCVSSAFTLGAVIFGFISFAKIDWPSGLEPWGWVHLCLGLAVGSGLIALAAVRIASWRSGPVGRRTAIAVLGLAGMIVGTAWVGGEILVYRAGVAVEAAGDGAFASSPPTATRAAWSRIATSIAVMTLYGPRDDKFAEIEDATAHLDAHSPTWARAVPELSGALQDDAARLAADARAHDLPALATDFGQASAVCARCHAAAPPPH